jgi:hypothetical protein
VRLSGWSKKALFAIVLLAGCGPVAPLGADNGIRYSEAVLDREGGVLTVDGARLTVPAGALSSDTMVYLRRTAQTPQTPAHITPLTGQFEVGPERAALAGRPRLELAYVEGPGTVVIIERSDCPELTARDSAAAGTTVGSGVATFELKAFGSYALGVAGETSCTAASDCPCGEACAAPQTTSYCDGTSGRCEVSDGCDQACGCPGSL